MAARRHEYRVTTTWTGNAGSGTAGYRLYERAHEVAAPGKPPIPASSDPAFRGDPARHNPEELLLAALSGCHMLWYLHLCAEAGVVVTGYVDHAEAVMIETEDGGGRFAEATLRPEVALQPGSDPARAEALHAPAHARCFVAASVNFPVSHAARCRVEAA